ncbi:hypothetical protein ACNOYE_13850 [Nannocystaceae bacterium ST9]
MNRVDPRSWNLSSLLSISLVACKNEDAPNGAVDEVGSETEEGPPECRSNADCPEGGVCYYNTCYTECEYYGCSPYEYCIDGQCGPIPFPELMPCATSESQEIPIPELGEVLSIEFADVDDDGDDELIGMRSNSIVVVTDDDLIVESPLPLQSITIDRVQALRLPGPGVDLVGWSSVIDSIGLFTGDGAGGFTLTTTLNGFPQPMQVVAIDPELDGVDGLAMVSTLMGVLWMADPPSGAYELFGVDEPISWIGEADALGDSAPEMLVDAGCRLRARQPPDWAYQPEFDLAIAIGGSGGCAWFLESPEADQALAIKTAADDSVLHLLDLETSTVASALVLDQRSRSWVLAELDGPGASTLVLADHQSMALVADWSAFPTGCFARLDVPADVVLAGDREGDGREELLLLSKSISGTQVRLFGVP